MDMILEKCSGTLKSIDDVIVYGNTKEDHDRNLHNLMKIEELRFKSDKCTVDQKQIHFFGAITDLQKVLGIQLHGIFHSASL